ncbi:Transient receptor potential cation channel subfamily V member 1 [Merluccius polli]|uniref:Transient receptor potential cation channel subfamily V member 1 n=1 Tax=Merluccius polli TaxID=89951 RepID=A0AA47NWZ6_MERPO|nr:Transient receptor potential cation channel subfamily V member 1 [Merluccius polli]
MTLWQVSPSPHATEVASFGALRHRTRVCSPTQPESNQSDSGQISEVSTATLDTPLGPPLVGWGREWPYHGNLPVSQQHSSSPALSFTCTASLRTQHTLLCLKGVQSQSIFHGKRHFKLQNPETMSESLVDRNLLGPCLDRDMDLEHVDLENSNLMTGDSFSREPMDSSIAPMDTFLDLDLTLETSNLMTGDSFTPMVCVSRAPMDTRELPPVSMREEDTVDHGDFSRNKLFDAASKGDPGPLSGLQQHLELCGMKLTSPKYIGNNGKTALLKAVLHLKDGKNDTIQVLLDIAEKCGHLEELVNASYNDESYKGQTALHVAIERRSFDQVKLLLQKGAEVQAKANGLFFQYNSKQGFYFGELPLSLAACTNQLEVVSFLMDNEYSRANSRDYDSLGNTVLHALVLIADNTKENTDFIIRMYDEVLIRDTKLAQGADPLEAIENKQGLTPLKLAAKMGKIGLFRHMVQREFTDHETRALSRKFTDWIYGPIHSSLYDMTSIDTSEPNSVLEIIVFGSAIENRQEMLQVEPLHSLLEEKWERFASKLFLVAFLGYLVYLVIFTTVTFYRKEGQPPFPVENTTKDAFRCIGELISALGAVYFFIKALMDFKRRPPRIQSMHIDGCNEISLFCWILSCSFVQATFLLVSIVMYVCGRREYVVPQVFSLALAWINILYYSHGSRHLGMYNVMIQRIIISDIIRFLVVYVVFLIGFSAVIVALMEENPFENENQKINIIYDTALDMFKLTIGMGELKFKDNIEYIEVLYILLITYILLTYIMLFNMLIAQMSETVDKVYKDSESIWRLQGLRRLSELHRALTFLGGEHYWYQYCSLDPAHISPTHRLSESEEVGGLCDVWVMVFSSVVEWEGLDQEGDLGEKKWDLGVV